MSSLKYRPEIDGLRAIAVVSVVLYHAHIFLGGHRLLPGGFLGVDIFFVISGYLISKIILTDIIENRFSFMNFYERRARRILPALFLVMAASIPFATIMMLPKAFGEYADSLMATLFFGSNIFFWMQDSYTAVASDYKPFLHTWSLSVEEQFYLFFPPLLLLLARKKLASGLFFAALIFCSFILAISLIPHHADAAFYLLPTRAWELLAGYLVARHEIIRTAPETKKWGSWAGIVLIALPLFLVNDTMPHPGIATISSVIGAVLILVHGRGNWLLSFKPAVLIGLASYSFYLWHQPVFAFARIHNGGTLSTLEKGGLILLSLLLAAGSWYFVERPFRNRDRTSTKTLWLFVLGGAVFFTGFYAVQKAFDLKGRLVPINEIAARATDMTYIPNAYRDDPCRKDAGPYCVRGKEGGARWIVVGDSHLDRVAPVLWDRLKDKGVQMTFLESGGCGYAPGMEVMLDGKPDVCTAEINQSRRDYLLAQPPSTIVVMARYPLYIEGAWFNNGEGGLEDTGSMMMRPAGKDLPDGERKKAVASGVTSSIKELLKAGHKIILVYPVPEAGWDVPAMMNSQTKGMDATQRMEWMESENLSTSHALFKKRTGATYAALNAVPDQKSLIRIYPEKLLCRHDRCLTHDDAALFYSDDDHLSQVGANKLVDQILKSID